MTGRRPPLIFQILWRFISPIALLVMLVLSLYKMMVETPKYVQWDNATVSLLTFYEIHALSYYK